MSVHACGFEEDGKEEDMIGSMSNAPGDEDGVPENRGPALNAVS